MRLTNAVATLKLMTKFSTRSQLKHHKYFEKYFFPNFSKNVYLLYQVIVDWIYHTSYTHVFFFFLLSLKDIFIHFRISYEISIILLHLCISMFLLKKIIFFQIYMWYLIYIYTRFFFLLSLKVVFIHFKEYPMKYPLYFCIYMCPCFFLRK